MTTIGEAAQAYEPPQTKNIADLEVVPMDIGIQERTFQVTKDGKTKDVTINVVVVEGEDYRVPASVLKQLKEQKAANQELAAFKVSQSGSGLNTSYTVIPLGNKIVDAPKETVEVVKPGEEAKVQVVKPGEAPEVPKSE